MNSKLIFIAICLSQSLVAQNFAEVIGTPFEGVYHSSIAFADVDGDSDQDLFIAGRNIAEEGTSRLYTNDGTGNFTEVIGTPFDGFYFGSVSFADVDGDGDQDLLITGGATEDISKLYANDGLGNFTEIIGTPFDAVSNSSVAFADVDGDSDQDLLITGNHSGAAITRLYINDGIGGFTEQLGTPLEDVSASAVSFSDVDGDDDLDLLITGKNNSAELIARLYLNDGSGNFVEISDTPFIGVGRGTIVFTDVDGDNDNDLLVSGTTIANNLNVPTLKLYINDGLGYFTEKTDVPFDGLFFSSIALSDMDGDGDQDLLLTGNVSAEGVAKLYVNDGIGNFTELTSAPFSGVTYSSILFSDVDSDGDEDVLITGSVGWALIEPKARLYMNNEILSSAADHIHTFSPFITTYPNPTPATIVNIRIGSIESGPAILKVFDMNGDLFCQQKEFIVIGEQTIAVDIASLAAGAYVIQLEMGSRRIDTTFLVH